MAERFFASYLINSFRGDVSTLRFTERAFWLHITGIGLWWYFSAVDRWKGDLRPSLQSRDLCYLKCEEAYKRRIVRRRMQWEMKRKHALASIKAKAKAAIMNGDTVELKSSKRGGMSLVKVIVRLPDAKSKTAAEKSTEINEVVADAGDGEQMKDATTSPTAMKDKMGEDKKEEKEEEPKVAMKEDEQGSAGITDATKTKAKEKKKKKKKKEKKMIAASVEEASVEEASAPVLNVSASASSAPLSASAEDEGEDFGKEERTMTDVKTKKKEKKKKKKKKKKTTNNKLKEADDGALQGATASLEEASPESPGITNKEAEEKTQSKTEDGEAQKETEREEEMNIRTLIYEMPDIGPEPPRYQRAHIRPVPELYHINYFRGTPWMKMEYHAVEDDLEKIKEPEKNPDGTIEDFSYADVKWNFEHAVGGPYDLPWRNIDMIDGFNRIAMRDELAKHRPELLTYDQEIQWWTETETMMREGPFNASGWGPVSEYTFL